MNADQKTHFSVFHDASDSFEQAPPSSIASHVGLSGVNGVQSRAVDTI